jgi:hypothetical protein
MANAHRFLLVDASGAPVLGAAASMTVSAWDIDGVARTAPNLVELGEGIYYVEGTDDDEVVGTIALVDCTGTGAGNEPRRVTIPLYVGDGSNMFWAWHVEDTAGALWTGAAPTIATGSYRSKDGVGITPPAVRTIAGAYLYAVVPPGEDIIAEVGFRIDGPAGSAVRSWLAEYDTYIPGGGGGGTPPAVAPPPQPSSTYQRALAGEPTPILWADYQEELAPPWLRAGSGRAWLRAIGDAKDGLELRAKDAVRARFPDTAPADALDALAAERQLAQGPAEAQSAFRARLKAAWDVWPWAGTPQGLLRAYAQAGYPNVALLTNGGYTHVLDGSSNVVTTKPVGSHELGSRWNTYRVLFFAPLPAWWSPIPDNASDEVNSLRRIARTWQAGHAELDALVVQSGRLWGYPASQVWTVDALFQWGSSSVIWTP